MAAVLNGKGTASMSITNVSTLLIQVADDGDSLFYQFLDVADEKAYAIQQAEVEYVDNDDSGECEPAFYLEDDKKKETPYFLSEFVRNDIFTSGGGIGIDIPAQGGGFGAFRDEIIVTDDKDSLDLGIPGMGGGLPVGRITEMYGRNIIK